MNLVALQSAVVAWARTASGLAAVWAEPNAPRPAEAYCRLNLIGPRKVGGDDQVVSIPNTVDFEISGLRAFTLSVNIYAKDAAQRASDMITSLSKPSVLATLSTANLSVTSVGDPRDLSQLLETKVEKRVQFDVELLTTETAVDQPGVIEDVEASGSVGGQDIEISTVT